MITVTAFKWVPPFAQGLVRDLRVRWALEEAGIPYEAKLLGRYDGDEAAYRAIQPWGQVPTVEEDGLTLFESGAILIHLAGRSEALAPSDVAGAAKATQWVLAALNSVEPHVQNLVSIDLFYKDEDWAKLRRPGQEAFTRMKLASLAKRLQGREWLEDRFTIGDLTLATVLRLLRHTDIVTADPVLGPYLARCEARPAFQKALADQLEPFKHNAPALEPA
ncbi:MAG: glutathione S-transferase family protein [Caulobacteraceae bacterium]